MIQLVSNCHETAPAELVIRSFEDNIRETKAKKGQSNFQRSHRIKPLTFPMCFVNI